MNNQNIALRWTEERSRLGFSQADIARKVGVTRETMRKYENGLTIVSAEVLSNSVTFGFDVQYILSGIRSNNLGNQSGESPLIEHTIGSVKGVGIATGKSTVHVINTENHVTRTIAEVKPGTHHITDAQAFTLQGLVNQIVTTEESLKKKPAAYRSVWGSLNNFCRVPKYRLILLSDYDKARKYLDQWMGRLNSMASAPVKDGDKWRKRHYAYIKINSKEQVVAEAVKKYMQRKYKAVSLTELSNDELDAVYKYVAGKKNKRK